MQKILMLIIDGLGYIDSENNIIKEAKMDNFNRLWNEYPHSLLETKGIHIGLPEEDIGNSKICHTAIGLGKKIKQRLTIIEEAFNNNSILKNTELNNIVEHVITNDSILHLVGLISDAKINSDMDYILKIIPILKEKGVNKIIFHVITDGVDIEKNNILENIDKLNKVLNEYNIGHIGTICGRFYAMDKDNNWERTRVYTDLLINGKGLKVLDPSIAINNCYKRGLSDEFIPPLIVNSEYKVEEHDALLLLNFKTDTSRQIIKSITDLSFDEYPIGHVNNLKVDTMFKIDDLDSKSLFIDTENNYSLSTYFSDLMLTQARISETENFNNITYYFDGEINKKLKNCDDIEIESEKVKDVSLKPQMKLEDLLKTTIKCINKDYDFILVNIENADIISQTGKYKESIKCLKYIDEAIKILEEKAKENFYKLIITSSCGKIEQLTSDNNELINYTDNPVPFILCDKNIKLKEKGDITMISPTLLKYLDIKIPNTMSETELLFLRED